MRNLRLRVALGLLIALTVVATTLSFASAFTTAPNEPRSGYLDGLYATLQLFTVSMERHEMRELPWIVNAARFVAPLLTLGAVYVALFDLTARLRDRRTARRLSGHHVVCGDSAEATRIAEGLARSTHGEHSERPWRRRGVVLVARHLDQSAVDRARSLGLAVVLTTPGSPEFASALSGATAVTVCGTTDRESLEWAVAADQVEDTTTVSALLRRPERAMQERGRRFRFAALHDRIAHGVVVAWPFRPGASSDSVAVVVGSGAGASSLAQRLVSFGTRRVGHRVAVVAPAGRHVRVGGRVSLVEVPSDSIADVAATLGDLSTLRSAGIGGPVYVWSDDPDHDLTLAMALSDSFPELVIIAVLPAATATDLNSSAWPNLHIVGTMDALVSGHLLANTTNERLARALSDDRALFGGAEFVESEGAHALDVLGLDDAGVASLSGEIMSTLGELGLSVASGGSVPLMLAAEEIRLLSTAMSGGHVPEGDVVGLQPFIDLAARVPQLLELASISMTMSAEARGRVRLDWESADRMARAIGANYLRRVGEPPRLESAEASAADLDQALDIPAKLASCGLRLSRGAADHDAIIDVDDVERLAEFEHQRWCRQRREWGWTFGEVRDNQQRRHPDLIPWSQLSETSKEKDRAPIREISQVLAEAGLGMKRLVEGDES